MKINSNKVSSPKRHKQRPKQKQGLERTKVAQPPPQHAFCVMEQEENEALGSSSTITAPTRNTIYDDDESNVNNKNDNNEFLRSDSIHNLMAGLEIELEEEDDDGYNSNNELLFQESSNNSSSFNFLIPSRHQSTKLHTNSSYYPRLKASSEAESSLSSLSFSSFSNNNKYHANTTSNNTNNSFNVLFTKNVVRRLLFYIGIMLFISIPMISYDWNEIVLDEQQQSSYNTFDINYKTIHEKKMNIIHSNSFLYDSWNSTEDNQPMTMTLTDTNSTITSITATTLSSSNNNNNNNSSNLNNLNELNLRGHYVHNTITSPYASHYYLRNDNEHLDSQQQEQLSFSNNLEKYSKQYGYWDFFQYSNADTDKNQIVNSSSSVIEQSSFNYTWQLDTNYTLKYQSEALRLIKRVRNGILKEYGLLSSINTTTTKIHLFNSSSGSSTIHDTSYNKNESSSLLLASMSSISYKILKRKLLYAIIHNKPFSIVFGGNNNIGGKDFFQTKGMSFHNVLEPIFDKLGMTLMTRNMERQEGDDIVSLLLNGNSINGHDNDLFIWTLNRDHEEQQELIDGIMESLLHQTSYSKNKIPNILFQHSFPRSIFKHTKTRNIDKLWIGEMNTNFWNTTALPISHNFTQVLDLPYAVQYLHCAQHFQKICDWKRYKFNTHCWVNRTDVAPMTTQNSYTNTKDHDVSFRYEQFQSRKYLLLILHALEDILKIWKDEEKSSSLPPPSSWQLQPAFHQYSSLIRQQYGSRHCRKLLSSALLPHKLCTLPYTTATEWTPRTYYSTTTLRSIVLPNDGYVPYLDVQNQYHGPDLLLPTQRIPNSDIDVHALAILTSNHTTTSYFHKKRPIRSLLTSFSYTSRKSNITTSTTSKKWKLINHASGFCDGSFQSECNRQPSQTCLLQNSNIGYGSIVGDDTTGALTYSIQNVSNGVLVVRMELLDSSNAKISLFSRENEKNYNTSIIPDDFEIICQVNSTNIKQNHIVTSNKTSLLNQYQIIKDYFWVVLLLNNSTTNMSYEDKDQDTNNITLSLWIRNSHALIQVAITHITWS